MKVRVEAKKLKEPKVSFISLVERGANRLPFRILKSHNPEHEMSLDLDLTKIFKREKKETKPALMGVVVEKTDKLDEVKKQLTEAGLSVEVQEDQDKTVLFRQADGNVEEAVVIKMSDQSLALVTGVEKQDPVMPIDAVFNNAYGAVVGALMSDDRSSIEGVMKTLANTVNLYTLVPASVFKADTALINMVTKAEAAHKEPETVTPDPAAAPAAAPAADPAAPAAEEAKKAEGNSEQPAVQAPTVDVSAAIAEGLKGFEATIAKSLETVTASIETMKNRIGSIEEAAKGLDKKISEVETVAKAAEASIKKTVVASPPADDPAPTKPVRKQDDDPRTGVFDTAFIRKAAGFRAQKR